MIFQARLRRLKTIFKMKFLQNLWNEAVDFFGVEAREDSTRSAEANSAGAPLAYAGHAEAAVVACYFNPTKSAARRRAFDRFYRSVNHLNHRVVECVIGEDGAAELPQNENISRVYTRDVLWHKEALINRAVRELPEQFRYVFWLDADVLFTNRNWLPEAVARLVSDAAVVQPFEFAVHLEENEGEQPSFDVDSFKAILRDASALENIERQRHRRVWRSFAANWETQRTLADSEIYDLHGHVGFAWGARRELLEAVPLYDRALVGGADHVVAHAAAGQIPSACIDKSFTADLEEVYDWSRRFANETRGRLAFASGDVYHLWHGDLNKRDYLNRIRQFTPLARSVRRKDDSGLYTTDDPRVTGYVENYLQSREVKPSGDSTGDAFAAAESYANNQPPDASQSFPSETTPVANDASESWNGFGGGGDFAGGGAGGDWSGSDVSGSTSTDYQSGRETGADVSSSSSFAGIPEFDLTSRESGNFS